MHSRTAFPTRALVLTGLFSLVLSGCSGCSRKSAGGVSLSEQAAVRAEPDGKARVLTSLALAEQVEWLGDSVADPANPKKAYLKVRLSDGKDGWVNAWQLAAPAQAAVLLERTPLYRRPDQATASGRSLPAGELVARLVPSKEKEGDWVEVVTMGRTQRGWTLRPGLSSDPSELLAAGLVRKAKATKDPAKRAAALQELQANGTVASTRVWEVLKDSLAAAPVPAAAPAPVGSPDTAASAPVP